MVERLATAAGGVDEDAQIIASRSWPVNWMRRRPQHGVETDVFGRLLWCEGPIRRGCFVSSRLGPDYTPCGCLR